MEGPHPLVLELAAEMARALGAMEDVIVALLTNPPNMERIGHDRDQIEAAKLVIREMIEQNGGTS
jgi:hypothetical protein